MVNEGCASGTAAAGGRGPAACPPPSSCQGPAVACRPPRAQVMTIVLLLMMSFSGFLVSSIPVYFRWLRWVSYQTYVRQSGGPTDRLPLPARSHWGGPIHSSQCQPPSHTPFALRYAYSALVYNEFTRVEFYDAKVCRVCRSRGLPGHGTTHPARAGWLTRGRGGTSWWVPGRGALPRATERGVSPTRLLSPACRAPPSLVGL